MNFEKFLRTPFQDYFLIEHLKTTAFIKSYFYLSLHTEQKVLWFICHLMICLTFLDDLFCSSNTLFYKTTLIGLVIYFKFTPCPFNGHT